MRNAILASSIVIVGYLVCGAACGGSTAVIPDGGAAGSAGSAGASGSDGSGGSKGGAGSGGTMGSGGASGAGGASGSGNDGGKDAAKDAPTDSRDSGMCPGVYEAGTAIGLAPACEACVSSMCCSQFLTCSTDPECVSIEICTGKCIKGGGDATKCAIKCIGKDSGTSGSEAETLDECLGGMCAASCG